MCVFFLFSQCSEGGKWGVGMEEFQDDDDDGGGGGGGAANGGVVAVMLFGGGDENTQAFSFFLFEKPNKRNGKNKTRKL